MRRHAPLLTRSLFVAQGGLGVTGSGLGTLMQTAASCSPNGKASVLWYGKDVLGNYVGNQAAFNAAVTLLRTPAGRSLGGDTSYTAPSSWVYPPCWNTGASRCARRVRAARAVTCTLAR